MAERGRCRGRIRCGHYWRNGCCRGRMRTVEEMLGLSVDCDAVEDFLGRACAKSLECLYPGLKCRRRHLRMKGCSCGESRRTSSRVVEGFKIRQGSTTFPSSSSCPLNPPQSSSPSQASHTPLS